MKMTRKSYKKAHNNLQEYYKEQDAIKENEIEQIEGEK